MTIQLIVNADDYGRTPGISQGIRTAHLRGIVTSTTAMMNMPGVEAALQQALQECPSLGLGVHLVLTAGAPVLPIIRVSSLTGGEARFPNSNEQIERRAALTLTEVHAEWQAQIEKFSAVTGRAPDHLDSHHHISYLTVGLFQTMLELAQQYDSAIRLPLAVRASQAMSGLPSELLQEIIEFTPRLLSEYAPRHPDDFTAEFYDETATTNELLSILSQLPAGVTEIMCHPGYADEALLGSAGSSYNHQRENELTVLTSPAVRQAIVERGIELIAFAEL